MQTTIESDTQTEAAIAPAQAEQIHIDKVNDLLEFASREESLAVAILAIASIPAVDEYPHLEINFETCCSQLVKASHREFYRISDDQKAEIVRNILNEMYVPH